MKLINRVLDSELALSIICGITFAALTIQFIIVSTN